MENRYPCPCCGYLVHNEPVGSHNICPICFWEDDADCLFLPTKTWGANQVTLLQGQKNYLAFGACKERVKPFVRPPQLDEQQAKEWQPMNWTIDNINDPPKEDAYVRSYIKKKLIKDRTCLYYWSPTYWRKTFRAEQEQAQQQVSPTDEVNQ
jgi:hypothetical protein